MQLVILQLINNIPGNFWLRFITSHPKDFSDKLIETMAKCEKICEYLHLPIQSGDDEILARMNRGYTVEHYKNLICKIRDLPRLDGRVKTGKISTISKKSHE